MSSQTTSACSAFAYSTASTLRAHVRLGDDLEQRRAGAVEVDARPVAGVVERRAGAVVVVAAGDAVDRLAGVLLEVGAGQGDAMRDVADEELDRPALDHRRLVLADLVALGQVGIEVVLAGEDRERRHRRADRQAEADRPLDRAAVGHRQRARKRQVDRRGLGVGLGAEGGRCAAEDLRAGRELGMGLDPDHHLVAADQGGRAHDVLALPPAGEGWGEGARVCQSVACWNACAACSSVAFVEVVAEQLEADRHAAGAEAGRHAHAGQPGQASGQGEDVGQVVGDRVVALCRRASRRPSAPPGRRSGRSA